MRQRQHSCIVLILGLLVISGCQLRSPVLRVLDNTADFGVVAQGTAANATFRIKNGGTRTLEILSLDGGCSCLATAGSSTIAPEATGTVTAKLNTNAELGSVRRTIVLMTNDPQRPTTELILTGRVVPPGRSR